MLALTLGLGVWQLQRLAWKTALLAEIDRGEASPPIPLPTAPAPFRRVIVEGRFLPSVAQYGAEVRDAGRGAVMGARLLSPLVRPGTDPVIVDRGWAPLDAAKDPPPGPVRVEAYVRPAEHRGAFSVSDDPAARRFYTLDPVAIGAALGLPHVEPYTLVALGPAGTVPEPATALPRPPNDHLSYALTWFGLAASLVVVFFIYVRQTWTRSPPP